MWQTLGGAWDHYDNNLQFHMRCLLLTVSVGMLLRVFVCPQVVDMTKDIADIPEWFHGCTLNYAENLLKCEENKVALITYGEYPGIYIWVAQSM